MGQTLTHGVYLPDEGERNCYDGLASNWSILDGAVGTVAEHTSQIAGKAPAVHKHTKSDITDFPAYGNTAGTICEGNDSRLSDARTPLSHTHVKSNITDLFNSANTWTGDNIFTTGLTINNAALLTAVLQNAVKGDVSTTGDFAIYIKDKMNGNAATSLLATYRGGQDSAGSYAQIAIDTKGNDNNRYNNSISLRINSADNSNNAALIPQRDSTIDLGSSTNQWKSMYAQSYYYNGTEFQSKFVTLDTEQQITGLKRLKSGWWRLQAANLRVGAGEQYGRNGYTLVWTDKDDITICDIASYKQSQAERTHLRLRGGDYYTNGAPDASGTLVQSELRIGTLANGTRMIECVTDAVYSATDAVTDLGTSTNKWKTLNGINPGALSLPQSGSGATILDVTAQGLNWDLTGATDITYTPTFDGWLQLRCKDTDGDFLFATWGQIRQSVFGRGFLAVLNEGLALTIPVRKDITVNMRCKATANMVATVTPCLGNV